MAPERHVLALVSFDTAGIQITFKLLLLTMSAPITQLTVEEAHKEFNSLVDRIAAKYEQLDNGKFGAVGTLVFYAKSAELASLFAHVSQLCARLLMSAQLHRLPLFKH